MSDSAPNAADPFELARFELAQEGPFPIALRELQAGQKQSHWMRFIFPQITGLGSSPMAQRFAIQSRDEAAAYLAHPELGKRRRAARPDPHPGCSGRKARREGAARRGAALE